MRRRRKFFYILVAIYDFVYKNVDKKHNIIVNFLEFFPGDQNLRGEFSHDRKNLGGDFSRGQKIWEVNYPPRWKFPTPDWGGDFISEIGSF